MGTLEVEMRDPDILFKEKKKKRNRNLEAIHLEDYSWKQGN